MGQRKGIVLFIVEGVTEEISLALILSKIIEKDKTVKFKIVNGDITTKNGTSTTNILNRITNVIKEFLKRNSFIKKDIKSIIHLIDTDGVFINADLIYKKEIDEVEYCTDGIYTNNIEAIINRNKQKSQILNKLIMTDKVYTDIPYEVYFFSSNLEHVLHNEQMVKDDNKYDYATKFEDKYADNPSEFIKFINNVDFAIKGDYISTWEFIKKGNNSLKRFTNFHLFINKNI